jgi:hypothetical protein
VLLFPLTPDPQFFAFGEFSPSPAKLSSDTLTVEALKISIKVLHTIGNEEERSDMVVRGWLILLRADSSLTRE